MRLQLGLLAIVLKLVACETTDYMTLDASALASASASAYFAITSVIDDYELAANDKQRLSIMKIGSSIYSIIDSVSEASFRHAEMSSSSASLASVSSASLSSASSASAAVAASASSAAIAAYIATAASKTVSSSPTGVTSQPKPTQSAAAAAPEPSARATIIKAVAATLVIVALLLLAYVGFRRGWFACVLGKRKSQLRERDATGAEPYMKEPERAELGEGDYRAELYVPEKGKFANHVREMEAPCELPGCLPVDTRSKGFERAEGFEARDHGVRNEGVQMIQLGEDKQKREGQ